MTHDELLSAFEQLLAASRRACEVMRAGSCPRCQAQPVADDGTFDEDFALARCQTDDWADMKHAVIVAEERLSDAVLSSTLGMSRRELERAAVQIDWRLAGQDGRRPT